MSLRDKALGKVLGVDAASIAQIRRLIRVYRGMAEYVETRPQLRDELVGLLKEVINVTQNKTQASDTATTIDDQPTDETAVEAVAQAGEPEQGFFARMWGKARRYCAHIDTALDTLSAATAQLVTQKIIVRNEKLGKEMLQRADLGFCHAETIAAVTKNGSYLDRAMHYAVRQTVTAAQARKEEGSSALDRWVARVKQVGWTAACVVVTGAAYAVDFVGFMVGSVGHVVKGTTIEMAAAAVAVLYLLVNAPLLVWGGLVWVYYQLVMATRNKDKAETVPA